MYCAEYDRTVLVHSKVGRWYRYLSEGDRENGAVVLADSVDKLQALLRKHHHVVVLVDLALYDNDVSHARLSRLFTACQGQQVCVVSALRDEESFYRLMELGARGLCPASTNAEHLRKAVAAVTRGELWISRKLLSGYLYRLKVRLRGPAGPGQFAVAGRESERRLAEHAGLTVRELQIAGHVAKGKRDKEIAAELNISPYTVKNHVGNIFKKLDVSDRFQLALAYHNLPIDAPNAVSPL